MGRKCSRKYTEYDYEAAYDKALEDLQEDQQERILKEQGRKAQVYATKEIRSGNQLEIEIYPEFTKGESCLIPTEAQKKKRREAQRNLNEKNSRKMCERIINANFTSGDLWATFTYGDDELPETIEDARKDMQNYIRRLNYQRRKQGLKNARYVYVTEMSEKGRVHHHIVMDGDIDMDTVEGLWTKGRRNQVRRLDADEDGLVGMAKYITKEKKQKGSKKWTASRGLKKPEEKVNHYKFTNRDVREMAADDSCIERKMLKWYAKYGYRYAHAEVRYNAVNGRFYIRARLHRPEDRKGEQRCRGRMHTAGKSQRSQERERRSQERTEKGNREREGRRQSGSGDTSGITES